MSFRTTIIAGKTNHIDKNLMSYAKDFLDGNSGVVGTNDFLTTQSDPVGMSVTVGPGVIYSYYAAADTYYRHELTDAETVLAIDANSSGSTRIDLICVKTDLTVTPDADGGGIPSLIVVKGTPGAGVPATPANHDKLYEVSVANGEDAIENAHITDQRDLCLVSVSRLGSGTADSTTFLRGDRVFAVPSSEEGWTPETDTWVYVAPDQFKVEGSDVTARFPKGARLMWTDSGGVKKGTVRASTFSTDTTVSIFVNTDFTIANSAITSPKYSYQANPQGYPSMFNFASTVNGSGGSAGAYAETIHLSKFSVIGNKVSVHVTKNITNVGSWSGSVQLALPVTPSSDYSSTIASFVNCYLTSNAAVPGAGSLGCLGLEDDNSFGTFVKQINTAALTWADIAASCVVHGDFSYYF